MTPPTLAAADLAAVREQWPDLLDAIGRRPAAEWPPRERRGFLDQLDADDEQPHPHPEQRAPLVLREHPAPLNLDALDAALDVERALFESCDAVASRVQRPVRRTLRTGQGGRTVAVVDAADRDDPARWHYASATTPGSRAHGVHWAALWLEGRALGEQSGDLFAPLPLLVLDDLAAVASRARTRVDRALERDGRVTVLDVPCPWCRGPLVVRTASGDPTSAVATCHTGEACGAPAILDHGRRTWRGAELVRLWGALDAARNRG